MIKLFLLVATLIAGLVIAPEIAGNQGYVLISIADKTVEMSVTTLAIFILALLAALFVLEWILKRVFSVGGSTRSWFIGRKARKSRTNTALGMVKLREGEWLQAEKLTAKSASHSDAPLLNYLVAAEAAQGRGDVYQRDEYLKLASEQSGNNILAVGLTRAQLEIDNSQFEQALATLNELKINHVRNPIILKLLKQVYLQLEDWSSVIETLPTFEKNQIVTQEEALTLSTQAYSGKMTQIAHQSGSAGLLSYWNDLPRKKRHNVELIVVFVQQMVLRDADEDAYMILRDSMKKIIDPRLITLAASLNLKDYHPLIQRITAMLKYDEKSIETYRSLALLYMKESQWGEAKTNLEKAIELGHDLNDYASLATVLEKLDDKQGAAEISRIGMQQKIS
ncbi:heme biosynthesis protein HemY [Vibrio sp. SS-MA-C1-2]|uniref:heme biosynthesis HemY N-terminal domain-containing protein n=1 Tax=Vibrio sp. SS-MA-C1-2 TaxID=2908646 RepID=UPI001F428BD7|nr:heme biosynthesis HemY N-terminal domain-containing protein [Vibrio sp. SS-MA-C1-2]UJF19403.1 heme biosynthesis protein HemY [Vibrio sp. SS-MA-C1-2]